MSRSHPPPSVDGDGASGVCVLLIDDHPLFAEGVSTALARHDASMRLECAWTLEDGLRILDPRKHALVLLDLRLPGVEGLTGFLAIRRRFPSIKLAVLSGTLAPGVAHRLVSEGADGVMSKDLSPQVLVAAVRLILDGGIFVPPHLLLDAVSDRSSPDRPVTSAVLDGSARARLRAGGASEREVRVAELMSQGQSNKEIARALDLQEGTVKVYVSAVLRILRVNNRVRATLALQSGRLADPQPASR